MRILKLPYLLCIILSYSVRVYNPYGFWCDNASEYGTVAHKSLYLADSGAFSFCYVLVLHFFNRRRVAAQGQLLRIMR